MFCRPILKRMMSRRFRTAPPPSPLFFFFLNDPAPPEISPLPLPAALPICAGGGRAVGRAAAARPAGAAAPGADLVRGRARVPARDEPFPGRLHDGSVSEVLEA